MSLPNFGKGNHVDIHLARGSSQNEKLLLEIHHPHCNYYMTHTSKPTNFTIILKIDS